MKLTKPLVIILAFSMVFLSPLTVLAQEAESSPSPISQPDASPQASPAPSVAPSPEPLFSPTVSPNPQASPEPALDFYHYQTLCIAWIIRSNSKPTVCFTCFSHWTHFDKKYKKRN